MDEQEVQEFSLEDIMREFGSGSEDDTIHDAVTPELLEDLPVQELLEDAPVAEHLTAEAEPELLTWTPRPKAAPAADLSDTQSFAPVTTASAGDTQRIDTEKIRAQAPKGSLSDDTPVGETVAPAGAEPFSANWEPRYDQPVEEYTPPEPIIFRPRSRLGELKRKLMEGPEQRYYALSEQGVGKLQIALFVSMLIVVLAVASIVLHRLDMVRENRMRLLVFGELFAMLVSALLCWERLTDGIAGLFKARFNTDTLLLFSFAACIADGIYCLQAVKVPFCAAFSLQCLMCLWSEYQKRCTELHQMDTLRKATRLSRIIKAENCHEGRPGFAVTEGQPEDFMDTYRAPSAPQTALDRFTLIALAASILVAVAAGIRGGVQTGIHTWSAAILAACPATLLISQTRPAWTLQRRLHRFGSVICGWQGVKASGGRTAVPLSDENLLPMGSVKVNGIKFYSSRNPDTIAGYATAIMTASGSCLAPLFEHMHKSRRGQSFVLDEYKSYSGRGCGAIICGESVLLGTQEFLKSMGIDLPGGTQVDQAVYIAIDGEFCGVFAVTYAKSRSSAAGLRTMCSYRGLRPILVTEDFMLTESFIRSRFGVNTRRVCFPQRELRASLAAVEADSEQPAMALITSKGLAPYAFAVTGARSVRTASWIGVAIHLLGGILGLGMMAVLAYLGEAALLTPTNLLLYEMVWLIPGLLITEWTRSV